MRVAEYISTRKVLFFDLFHTLTGVESGWSEIPPTCELLGVGREEWNVQLLERSRDRLVGTSRDPIEFLGRMARAIDPSISDERIREAARLRRMRFASSLIDIPAENLATLAELRRRGAKLCLISNADASEAEAWGESPLASLFEEALFSCDVGTLKPEPEIYELGLERMDAKAADSAFIGDGGSSELAGARRVGLGTVMVEGVARELWPDLIRARRREADYSIECIPELIDEDPNSG